MSGKPVWALDQNRQVLYVDLGEGRTSVPTALELFDVEFGYANEIDGVTVPAPSSQMATVAFHATVAPLRIRLASGSEGVVALLTVDDQLVQMWPVQDQIVIDSNWYPLEAGVVENWRARFNERGINLGVPLDSAQVLWLLWDSGLPVDTDVALDELNQIGLGAAANFNGNIVRANLYPYQQSGAAFLARMFELGLGTLLADEMGLGKTMQALYVLCIAATANRRPSLVIAPASVIANWEREIAKFAPALTYHLHLGGRRTGNHRTFSAFDLVITSYDLLIRDRYLLDQVDWSVIVLDEAQAIKNSKSQRSQAVKSLPRRSSVAITGTPIENSLTDVWSILEFIAPQYLGTLDEFVFEYPDETAAARELSIRIAPMTIRRTVSEVASDLPPRVDIPTPIFVSTRLGDIYEAVRSNEVDAPLVKLTKLRQIATSPSILDAAWGPLSRDFPKFDRLVEIVSEAIAEGGKVLVFAPFIEGIDAIQAGLRALYPEMLVDTIDGRRSPIERQSSIDRFTSVSEPSVLVLNPRAAGIGLNIQAANYVVHFSPEWNPALVAQASARSHRRGQTRPVFVYYLYYVDTVEEIMMERLEHKRELQDAALSHVAAEPSASEVLRALDVSPKERRIDG